MNFKSYLRAGYAGLWCETYEESRAIEVLAKDADGYE